jgi:hypothetical protein
MLLKYILVHNIIIQYKFQYKYPPNLYLLTHISTKSHTKFIPLNLISTEIIPFKVYLQIV